MSDTKIREEIQALPVQELRLEQFRTGRKQLAPEFVTHWARVHEKARDWLDDERRGQAVRRDAKLLSEITFALYVKSRGETLTYYPYTDVHLISWYLGRTHTLFRELKERALQGVFFI